MNYDVFLMFYLTGVFLNLALQYYFCWYLTYYKVVKYVTVLQMHLTF